MRWFHRLGTYTTLLPLLFGYLSILGGQSTFGYGLFLAGGWTLLSRGQALLGGAPVACTLEMAHGGEDSHPQSSCSQHDANATAVGSKSIEKQKLMSEGCAAVIIATHRLHTVTRVIVRWVCGKVATC